MIEKTDSTKFDSLQIVVNKLKSFSRWKVIISILIPIIGIVVLWKNKMFKVGTRIVFTFLLLNITYIFYINSNSISSESKSSFGNSVNGKYVFDNGEYYGEFRIRGDSFQGFYGICFNGDCDRDVTMEGIVKDYELFQEPLYSQLGEQNSYRGYINKSGKLHIITGMGEMILEK